MMVIRPVEPGDLPGLLKLAAETGGGLTSLPVDEATLAARIARSQQTPARRATEKRAGLCLCAGGERKRRGGGHLRDRGGGGAQRSLGITTGSAPSPCLEGAQRLSGAADAVSQQRSYRQQRAVHPVPRPAVAQRGQWLSAVEITLLIYGRLSRALQ